MKKVSLLFLSLVIILIFIQFNSINQFNSHPIFLENPIKIPQNPLYPSYSNENRTTRWINYTDTGNFTAYIETDPFDDFDDTKDYLYGYCGITGYALEKGIADRNLTSWDLYAFDVKQIFVNFSVKFEGDAPESYGLIYILLCYTDMTATQIYYAQYSLESGIEWYNGTVLYNISTTKKIKQMRVELWAGNLHNEATMHSTFWLWDEKYNIYEPLVADFQISPDPISQSIELGDPVNFKCDIYPLCPTYDRVVLIKYIPTDTTIPYYLDIEPFDYIQNYIYLSFNLSGTYIAQIRVKNGLGWSVYSEPKAFTVYEIGEGYPKTTHLSLWSPYDDLSLTGSLKTYLGNDKSYKITDFKDEFGYGTNLSWSRMYLTNQPFIRVYNSRLYLIISGNGAKATLQDTINITYYDSLKFSLKVKNSSEFPTNSKVLYIIQNPSAWTGDYRLNLSQYTDYLDTWVTFIIPLKLFTLLYYSDSLNEIGFYSPSSSGLLDCEIRDIYVSNYNTLYPIINDTGQTFTTNETIIRPDLDPLSFSFQNTTSQTLYSTINQTFNQSKNYSNGFNNSQANWENVTIPNNATVKLNNCYWWNNSYLFRKEIKINSSQSLSNEKINITTVNNTFLPQNTHITTIRVTNVSHQVPSSVWDIILNAKYNWENDSDGSNPSGWTVSEGADYTIDVIARKDDRKKIVEFFDNTSASRTAIYQTISGQVTGTLEYWFQIDKNDVFFANWLKDGVNLKIRCGVQYYNNLAYFFSRNSSGYEYITPVSNNTWHHLRLFFNMTSDKTKYWLNCDYLGEYNNFASGNQISRIDFSTGTSLGEEPYTSYLDALDYSWVSGYYLNRNYHLEDCQVNFNVTLTANENKDYYLYYHNESKEEYSAGLSRICTYFVNYTINSLETYNSSYSLVYIENGFYISEIKYFDYFVKVTNVTFNWSNQTNTNIDIFLKNETSGWLNYSDFISSTCSLLLFKVLLNASQTYNKVEFFNLTINYTYYQHILNVNITKQFNIPKISLINFTFNWSGKNNKSINSSHLNIYNFSSNSFYNIGNITNTSQILTFSNNSNFYSSTRNFTWNLIASDLDYFGFSIIQTNYTLEYYRYLFDRQVIISTVNISSYSSDLYGFTFESDFSNINARTRLYFQNLTGSYLEFEQFNLTYNYTLFRQFSDYGLTQELINAIRFNFTLFNCSTYNQNATINFSKFYLYENQTNRLYDESNRMPTDVLSFDSEIESLLLTDYWGDIIYREQLNRTEIGEYLDILIPYFTISIQNLQEYDVFLRIEKNNVIRTYRILASFELNLKLILSDYKLIIVDGVKEITIYEGVLSHTSRGSFSYGTAIPFIDWESILTNILTSQAELNAPFYKDNGFWVGLIIALVGFLPIDYYFVRRRLNTPNFQSESLKEYNKAVQKEKNHKAKKKIRVPLTVQNYEKNKRRS